MTAYAKTWLPNAPAGTDYADQLETFITDHKQGEAERLATEHYSLGNTGSIENKLAAGRHRPGLVGVLYKGTTAQINAIIATRITPANVDSQMAYGPGEGAIYYNTDTGIFYSWDSAAATLVPLANLGASSGAPEVASSATDSASLDSLLSTYFRQNKQNTTGRTIEIALTAGLNNTSLSAKGWGFQIYVGSAPPLSLTKGGFILTRQGSSDPAAQLGSTNVLVPPSYYYFIRIYTWVSATNFDWSAVLSDQTTPTNNAYCTGAVMTNHFSLFDFAITKI